LLAFAVRDEGISEELGAVSTAELLVQWSDGGNLPRIPNSNKVRGFGAAEPGGRIAGPFFASHRPLPVFAVFAVFCSETSAIRSTHSVYWRPAIGPFRSMRPEDYGNFSVAHTTTSMLLRLLPGLTPSCGPNALPPRVWPAG
jgi:hypothetical protein